MHRRKWIVLLALLALPALALARTYTIGAGKVLGYFIWADKEGFHLRWCTDGKPYLFTGRIDADKPIKELTDVRKESGGWAKIYGNRIVMFSKTSRGQVDGLDLTIPQGQVFLGQKGQHPKGVPLKIQLR